MRICKNLKNNFCTHYQKENPPLSICKKCKFYVAGQEEMPEKPVEISFCDIHKQMSDDPDIWCFFKEKGYYRWINNIYCNGECEELTGVKLY